MTAQAQTIRPLPKRRWLRAALAAADQPMPVLPFQRAARKPPKPVVGGTRPAAVAAR